MAQDIVIAGIGTTDFCKDSRRSEHQLAVEAIIACLDDAGIGASEIDGMVTFTMDETSEVDIRRELGCESLRYFSRVPFGGGGGCATVSHAAMAIRAGIAHSVVVYRSLNTASKVRFGSGRLTPPPESGDQRWFTRLGLITPAARVGITARRYLHRYGLDDDAYAPFALTAREYAVTNPSAYYYKRPLSRDEYLSSPWISRPLRRFDCCQESDGAVALLVTTAERARDLKKKSAKILASAQNAGTEQFGLAQYWCEDILELPEVEGLRQELRNQCGMEPREADVAMLYDHFTPLVALQLEQFGFCDDGEATSFAAEGNLRIDGSLPMNTHGGHLGEAYLHGMTHIGEALRQLRGEAVNQVGDVSTAFVASAASTPGSALMLGQMDSELGS